MQLKLSVPKGHHLVALEYVLHSVQYVLAAQRGWNAEQDLQFVVKNDFASMRNAVNDGSAAAFMWETFTTKPYHDSGVRSCCISHVHLPVFNVCIIIIFC